MIGKFTPRNSSRRLRRRRSQSARSVAKSIAGSLSEPLELLVEPLEERRMLAISIFAAGATGEEVMSLQVDGQTVRTWSNIGGDYQNGAFQAFTYGIDGIAPNRLRVSFLNDGTSANGGDRNLAVDRIEVDGRVIQSESPYVFSNGSWDEATGCRAGFKESQYLHCNNAYFDFSNVPMDGSTITVHAAGATGEEQMELQIDGQSVATWNNIGGDYNDRVFSSFTYQHSEIVDASRIRVAFTNDGATANGADRNLKVDNIVVDGRTYESEAATVYSTGTWTVDDGCTPGFKQSEELHCGGYLQFAQRNSVISIRAAGATGTEQVELLIDGVVVAGWDDVGGDYTQGVYQTLTYSSPTIITADQVRVAFVNDGTTADGSDRNVRIDGIDIDGQFFESESDTVFSTGTYRASDGCAPGFKASEELHCYGYLQFATTPANPGDISLVSSNYRVSEEDSSVQIVIQRTGGSDGLATVEYQSFAGTAEAGDFTSVSGRAFFQDGETTQTITIAILPDQLVEGDETFTFTIDNVGGTAGLLAPRTATITIVDDESLPGLGGFQFDTSALGTLFIDRNGTAVIQSNQLHLTGTSLSETGSAFYGQAIEFGPDTSFMTSFAFQLDGGNGLGGADGFTFTLHNTLAGTEFLGNTGGGLGYAATSTNSLAIEFDTYRNSQGDINDNHIAVSRDGSLAALVASDLSVDLNDGTVNYAWIEYDGATNVLEVYVAATNSQPDAPQIRHTIDIASIVGGQAYFGFTGATGGLTNRHRIHQWAFEASTELLPAPIDFDAQTLETGFVRPTSIDWSNDGRNLYIAEQAGIVKVRRDGRLLATPVIDIRGHVNGVRDRGLLDIAVHPDLASHPYLYLLYTYDPPEVNQFTGLAGPDGRGNRAGRLTRVTLDAATNYTTALPNSERVLLGSNSTWANFNGAANSTSDFNEPPAGILADGSNLRDFLAADSESHSVGSVEFGPDGALYVSNGDGASYNRVDPRAVRVQDIDNLSGKVLRINPLTGAGLTDNPFFNGDATANRSKVYQYGLRNPFRISVGPSGQVYVGDVGWGAWEEVNAGGPGANYGWPYYEGGNGTSLRTGGYLELPEAQAFYNSGQSVVAPELALSHSGDGINAIVVGDIYTGSAYPSQYQGDLLFNDLGQGIVRNISFDESGEIIGVSTFATGAAVVVQMKTGPDGYIYYVDLDDGEIGRWVPANARATDDGRSMVLAQSLSTAPVQLQGVTIGKSAIRISHQAVGPIIVNMAEGIIATEDGSIAIGDSVRKIIASGGRATDDAIHIVGTNQDDSVSIRPGLVRWKTETILVLARGYEQVSALGHDGNDHVSLRGSRDNDRLVARPGYATMTSGPITSRVYGFESINATAGRGGNDEAVLYDSASDDILWITKKSQTMTGEGFRHQATGFGQNTYHSTGGDDIAIWDDRGRQSQHMAGNNYAALFGQRLVHELNGWWRLYVQSSGLLPPEVSDSDA